MKERIGRPSLNPQSADCESGEDRRGASRLLGYRLDEEGAWVALLSCGHTQHLRHQPPWQSRPWIEDAAARAARIGEPFDCGWCRQTLEAKRH